MKMYLAIFYDPYGYIAGFIYKSVGQYNQDKA